MNSFFSWRVMVYRDFPRPKSVTAGRELVSYTNQRGERVDEHMQSTMDPMAVDICRKVNNNGITSILSSVGYAP